jgi:hypothetical protein
MKLKFLCLQKNNSNNPSIKTHYHNEILIEYLYLIQTQICTVCANFVFVGKENSVPRRAYCNQVKTDMKKMSF